MHSLTIYSTILIFIGGVSIELDSIVYGCMGGVYLKLFSLDNDKVLHFICTDMSLKPVYNVLLSEIKLTEFLQCVIYMNKCVTSTHENSLINLERNLVKDGVYGNEVEMYKNTNIISVCKTDDYCIGVSLQRGDNKQHDFMVVYKIFAEHFSEIKNSHEHDELTVYKSYKDGSIKVIYLTREEVIKIVSNCKILMNKNNK